ncbi:hypothetical protein [Snodgrassella communis]|uniref:hypothetical protein n=1 Tax=Snodgrassella communis TaxID=2946699 RepID=UPI000CCB4306|nr:hypothetical protein [Snodgrassella communis]PIT21374.1 hypothetical protein BGI35_05805 [Snodgrassella communis]
MSKLVELLELAEFESVGLLGAEEPIGDRSGANELCGGKSGREIVEALTLPFVSTENRVY